MLFNRKASSHKTAIFAVEENLVGHLLQCQVSGCQQRKFADKACRKFWRTLLANVVPLAAQNNWRLHELSANVALQVHDYQFA